MMIRIAVLAGLLCAAACGDSDGASEGRTLFYVANTGATTLSVIDAETRAVVDTIEIAALPHGQIPSHAGDRLYVTTEDTGELLAIDVATQEILWRVRGVENDGDELHQPSIGPDDRFVYAPDLLRSRLVVVDTQAAAVVDAIDVVDRTDPAQPMPLVALHNTYLSGDGRHVFVEGILSRRVARVDLARRTVDRVYRLSGDPRPIAILDDGSRMYVQLTDLEGFVEVDLESGEETRRVEWSNAPTASWLATEARLKPKSHGIGLTPDQTELWAASTMADRWYVYSVPDLQQLAVVEIAEGNAPNWIDFTADGRFAYLTNTTFAPGPGGEPRTDVDGTVTVVDTASYAIVDTIEVGPLPKRIHAVRLR